MRKPPEDPAVSILQPLPHLSPCWEEKPVPCADWAGDQGWEGEPGTGQAPGFAQVTREGPPRQDMCSLVPKDLWVW